MSGDENAAEGKTYRCFPLWADQRRSQEAYLALLSRSHFPLEGMAIGWLTMRGASSENLAAGIRLLTPVLHIRRREDGSAI